MKFLNILILSSLLVNSSIFSMELAKKQDNQEDYDSLGYGSEPESESGSESESDNKDDILQNLCEAIYTDNLDRVKKLVEKHGEEIINGKVKDLKSFHKEFYETYVEFSKGLVTNIEKFVEIDESVDTPFKYAKALKNEEILKFFVELKNDKLEISDDEEQ